MIYIIIGLFTTPYNLHKPKMKNLKIAIFYEEIFLEQLN